MNNKNDEKGFLKMYEEQQDKKSAEKIVKELQEQINNGETAIPVDGFKIVKSEDEYEDIYSNSQAIENNEEIEEIVENPDEYEVISNDNTASEDNEEIEEYEDIYSNSDVKNLKYNENFFKKHKKTIIAGTASALAVVTILLAAKGCGSEKKSSSETIAYTTSQTATSKNTEEIGITDELDVEVEVKTTKKAVIVDSNGNKIIENAYRGKDGKYYISKKDANTKTGVKVERGYLAPDGNVYESKADYDKLVKGNKSKNTKKSKSKKTTKKSSKKYYYASDGTCFESKSDRDKYESTLNNKTKYYYASDGTCFESKSDRDKYESTLNNKQEPNTEKQQPTTTQKYWEADDGSLFETKEEMERWNEYLRSQKAETKNNSSSSKREQINDLIKLRNELVLSTLTYNNEDTHVHSL